MQQKRTSHEACFLTARTCRFTQLAGYLVPHFTKTIWIDNLLALKTVGDQVGRSLKGRNTDLASRLSSQLASILSCLPLIDSLNHRFAVLELLASCNGGFDEASRIGFIVPPIPRALDTFRRRRPAFEVLCLVLRVLRAKQNEAFCGAMWQ
jgi:hypothetical protein